MPGSLPTAPPSRRNATTTRIALTLLCAFVGYTIWARAPRHHTQVGFVQIGADGDTLNLPLSSFQCALARDALGNQECERSFEGKLLRVQHRGSFTSAVRCRAQYAGRERACSPSFVHRGYPEGAVRIEGELGTTAQRRRYLRLLDPLSHAAECDWALPIWLFALLFAGLCTRASYSFLGDIAGWPRRLLVTASALVSTAFGMALASLLLLWLGYID